MADAPGEQRGTLQQFDMQGVNRVLEVGKLLMAVLSQEEILRLHQAINDGTKFVVDKKPAETA